MVDLSQLYSNTFLKIIKYKHSLPIDSSTPVKTNISERKSKNTYGETEVRKICQNQKILSEDEIKQIVQGYERGLSTYKLAKQFNCHRYTIADALKNGRAVVIDEFGSDLHPMLTRWIVNLFNGMENDAGAQLIVNTHDIGLMDIDGFLRRDEIWFTDKNRRNGSSALFSLSDINGVKKRSNVRKDYLMGRFDGIPAVIGVRKL